MSNIGNKFKIGVFVMSSLTVLVLSLIALGLLSYFDRKCVFYTIVSDSVQGLERGSKVKYKGVPVGKVTAIRINPDDQNVLIVMEFDPDTIQSTEIAKKMHTNYYKDRDDALEEFLSEKVKQGLRCQLKYGGITGNLYIEVNQFNPEKFPISEFHLPMENIGYLPSIPSTSFDNVLEQLETAMQKLSAVDYERLAGKIEKFIDKADCILDNKDITPVIKELKILAENMNLITNGLNEDLGKNGIKKSIERLREITGTFEKAMKELNDFTVEAKKAIAESKFPETSESARDFMSSSEDSIKNLTSDLESTLQKANETLSSAKELIDSLEQNPDSIIRGKAGKRVVEP